MAKSALITGITGQDGAYLTEHLLNLGYTVHGIKRRASQLTTQRIDHLYRDRHEAGVRLFLHYGDLSDSANMIRIIQESQPDEIYNLGAMSHVHVSFETALYTHDVVGSGIVRILEAVQTLGIGQKTRVYQASSSEMFGNAPAPQNESSPFYPCSPYAVAKLSAYWMTRLYRESKSLFASNGILFNHESPLRGETFVTRKVTRAVARIAMDYQKKLYLGNLDSVRDWGHAKDYVRAMHLILQHSKPDDFVIATGQSTTVRDFTQQAFARIGVTLDFAGKGLEEKAVIVAINETIFQERVGLKPSHLNKGDVLVEVLPEYFRPSEVHNLRGDSSKALKELGWKPKITLSELIREMVDSDLGLLRGRRPARSREEESEIQFHKIGVDLNV